jgi:2-C-methyl-D-erythritol 4-phosphate cytidylyltransferase
LPCSDTVKRAPGGQFTTETVSREGLYLAQTPQVFRRDWLEAAYAQRDTLVGATDDTQLVEALGYRCAIVPGSALNVKITTREDLKLAAAVLRMHSTSQKTSSKHPFADEAEKWADLPKLKASDLFDS